jgi:hypothetical protein
VRAEDLDLVAVLAVQMGEHDVPHVLGREPEPGHLPYGGLLGVEQGFGEGQEVAAGRLARVLAVAQPEPGLDENEPVRVVSTSRQ